MEISDLQGKMVAVVGYGMEGKTVTQYLLKHGVKPVLFDNKPWEQWPKQEQDEINKLGINFIFGPDCLAELKGFDVAFRSPGVKLKDLKIENLKITSQTKWFFEHCPAKIIGVTGTKGKGTTSSLIYEVLKQQASQSANHLVSKTYLTGNIGKVQPLEILESLRVEDWVVYELSSFQLQDLEQSPHIAVVLMVTSEHLDYHKDNAEYVEAKSSIAKFQKAGDVVVINSDFEASKKIGELSVGKKLYFSRQSQNGNCYAKDGEVISLVSDFRFPIPKLQLRGDHNLENVCAAVLAAQSAGASNDTIAHVLENFKGLEHRLELVAEKNGIKFYNDSFSTTPETAIAAIKSFKEPLVVVLGGSSKNSDFIELGKTVNGAKNIKTIILVGEEGKRIQEAIGKTDKEVLSGAENMQEIFGQIKTAAKPGDVVLLSPACASYGMFKNYKDRGEQFKNYALNY